jgi:hypothetical protein
LLREVAAIAADAPAHGAGAIALIESFEPFLEETLTPLADDLATGVQALGDLVVTEAAGREEDEAGSKDIAVR